MSAVVRFIVALVTSFCFRTTDVGRWMLVVVSLSHTSVHETSSTLSVKFALFGGSVVSHRSVIKMKIKIKGIEFFILVFGLIFCF